MTTNHFMTILKHAARAGSILFSGALLAFGQQQINLTAGPTNATMADGSAVPMWGYSCDAIQVAGSLATCRVEPDGSGGCASRLVARGDYHSHGANPAD